MKSAVRRVLMLSALMSPTALYALGLGEIHLHSALNQPFDADIDLVSAADEDLSALRASLASSDTFTRYGLDKPAYLSDFTFRVVRGADGRDVLKVTSPKPVTEPFVTMLVEASWPRGRLLREYTVLLDPPVFAPAPQAAESAVAAPRSKSTAPVPKPVKAAGTSSTEPFAMAPPPPRVDKSTGGNAPSGAPSIVAGSTYRVRQNDTLWKIASHAFPGTRSDVNQAMVAIFQANPQAFDGNINVLRAGSDLKIPQAGDVSAIPAAAASAEVARQYRMWREGSAAAAGPEAAGERLRLVTPEQGTPAASTATTPAPAATAGASAADLQARVQDLEAQLAEAKRLLEVKNAELATLQGQTAPAQPGVAPESGAAEQPTPAAEGAPEGEAPVAEAPEAAAPAAPPQPAPEAKPQPEKKPKPATKPSAPTLVERLSGYWWVLLGLLAAALAYVLYRRSRESGAAEDNLHEALSRPSSDLRARATVPVARPRESDIVVEERRPIEPPATRTAAPVAAPEPTRRPVSIEDTLSGEGPVSVEAGDPLAEADFHMAYGLYDQAADLVQLAIKREPSRRDLKLKLLEIFFVWGNRDRFVQLAREVKGAWADTQAVDWEKVVIMGRQLAPDEALFTGAAPASGAGLDLELHGSAGAIDMDLGAVEAASTATDIDLTAREPELGNEAGLDFVIDEPARGADDTSTVAPTIESPQLKARKASTEEPTQEVPIEELGIESGDLEALDEATGGEDMLEARPAAVVEDTVETPRPATGRGREVEESEEEQEDEDLLSATGILREQTGILPIPEGIEEGIEEGGEDVAEIDLSEATGELPTVEAGKLAEAAKGPLDFSLGEEAATMSEVGTKLDLARAYIDMGDPEGARSILDEVLSEGSSVQKQEAERLMSSLP